MLMIIMRYSVTASYDNNISHTDETLDHKLSKYLPSLNVSAITGRFLFSIGYYSGKPVFESKAGQNIQCQNAQGGKKGPKIALYLT